MQAHSPHLGNHGMFWEHTLVHPQGTISSLWELATGVRGLGEERAALSLDWGSSTLLKPLRSCSQCVWESLLSKGSSPHSSPHPCKGRTDLGASLTNMGVLSPSPASPSPMEGLRSREGEPGAGLGQPDGVTHPSPVHVSPSQTGARNFCHPGKDSMFLGLGCHFLALHLPSQPRGWKRREHPSWLLSFTLPSFPRGDAEHWIEG